MSNYHHEIPPALNAAVTEVVEAMMTRNDYVNRAAVAEEIIESFMCHGDSHYEISRFDTLDGNPKVFYFEDAYEEYHRLNPVDEGDE